MAGPAVAADGGGREATGRRLGVSRLGMLIVSLLCGVILHASSALGATCGYAAARLFPTCGMAISATEGEQFSGAVGTVSNLSFTVGRRALTELVTIDWGDGSSSTVQLPQHEGLRPIAEPVDASHVYAEEGSYAISWRASFLVGGRPIAVLPAGSGSATVADAPLAARSLTFAASVGQRFEGVVATFEDGDPGGAASDFSASIEWGDGTSSEGTVSQSGSSFVVSGVHTYRDPQLAVDSVEGADGPVHVSISDAGGASATTVSHVHVPLQASMAAVKPGSVSVVSLPLPLESVASIASAGGGPTGVSAYASSGELVLAASVEASAGEEMLAISGEGCISAGCGIHFDIDVPVDVTALAAPEGVALESFDTISPERLAEASPLPDGGARLPDELIVMTGTDDQPGDRASADAAAAAVEGTITGGVESEGVYEIRWKSPQDLAERVAELQAVPGVSAVSYEDVGTVSGDAVTPEDWGDLGEAAIWPAYQVEAPEAWEEAGVLGWDGGEGGRARATVGIVDVGLVDRYHPDLNVVQTIAPAGEGWMIGGHATRVAGLACAEANGFGIVGIGWGCPIVTSSVIAQPPNPNGAPLDTWGAAFRAAAKVAQTHPKAINMSLGINPANAEGHDQCATAQQLRDALAERVSWAPEFHRLFARTKGILWTLSAGNACVPYALSPMAAGAAGLRNVVVVAATNSDGHLASFSNFGPEATVAAPGGVDVDLAGMPGIYSTSYDPKTGTSGYAMESGTSFSAPIVAGIASLVAEAHPGFDGAQIAHCIESTAGTGEFGSVRTRDEQWPAGFTGEHSFFGSIPIVNAAAAVTCAPVRSGGGGATAKRPLAAGYEHTCALHEGGATCWGQNYWGQLGDGTTSGSTTPVDVEDLSKAVSIADGTNSSCALLEAGTVSCWGGNGYGQLGHGGTAESSLPVEVGSVGNATQMSVGGLTACARLEGGGLKCWGYDSDGQLGNGESFESSTFSSNPVVVADVSTATEVSVGGYHSCALLEGGSVKCWGRDVDGQLGDGMTTSTSTPVTVSGISDATAVSAGGYHVCALLEGGSVKCWGQNAWGQLGDGTTEGSSTPVTVSGISSAVSISAGLDHTCALLEGGSVKCWGRGDWGQLGDEAFGGSTTPVPVEGMSSATAVSAGGFHSCAELASGAIECWGRNSEGQLGDGTTTESDVPVIVSSL